MDGPIDAGEYDAQRRLLQNTLASLVLPEADTALSAGEFSGTLRLAWGEAILAERHRLLSSMLEAAYVDLAASGRIVCILPRPPFYCCLNY